MTDNNNSNRARVIFPHVNLQDFLDFRTQLQPNMKTKHHASQRAINSLKKMNLADLEDKTCGICMDAYFDESTLPPREASPVCESELDKYGSFWKGVYEDDPPIMFVPPGGQGLDDIDYHPETSEFGFEISPDGAEEDLSQSKDHIPVKMPCCNHVFGKSCIVSWLRENTSCPMCRTEVEADPTPNQHQRAAPGNIPHGVSFVYYVTQLMPREASTSYGTEPGDPPIVFGSEAPSMAPVRGERTGPDPSEPAPTDLPHADPSPEPEASPSPVGASSAGPVRGSDRSNNRAHPYSTGQSW